MSRFNGFCPFLFFLTDSVLNGQYQDEWNTNQNQMKSMHPFYIAFQQVLKVLLIKICKMQLLDLFTSADIIFYKVLELH